MEENNRSIDGMINDMNFSDFEAGARQNRQAHYVPMTKWGIRYDNENGNLSVSDFIESVARKAILYRVSDYELYENFGELLGGNPLIWYRAFKDRYVTWHALKHYFVKQFTKPDNDHLIERQLQSRLQLPGESFGIYYACMELLFKKLSKRTPEAIKLEYLIRNLNDFYLNRIQEEQIKTVEDLTRFCEGLERSQEILRRRKLSQYPLAEPSLQGRVHGIRREINEVRSDSNSNPFFDITHDTVMPSETGNNQQYFQKFPSVSSHHPFYPTQKSYPKSANTHRCEAVLHCSGSADQGINCGATPSHPEVGYCSQFSHPTNNCVYQGHGRNESHGQNSHYLQSFHPLPRGTGCSDDPRSFHPPYDTSCGFGSTLPHPEPNSIPVSVGKSDGSQFSPMINECAAIREFSGRCFNCKNIGHHWRNCQQPKKLFCHRCGLEGKTMHSCSNCSGNREPGSRS